MAKVVYKNAMTADEAEPMWAWKFMEASLKGWILSQLLSDNEMSPDLWIVQKDRHA